LEKTKTFKNAFSMKKTFINVYYNYGSAAADANNVSPQFDM